MCSGNNIHRKRLIKTLVIVFLSVIGGMFSLHAADLDPEWHLEIKKSDMSVFTRKLAHSSFLQVKAEVNLPVPIAKVIKQFGDGSQCWQWAKRCQKSELLEQKSPNEFITHTVLNFPWPVTDRDFVFHTKKEVNQSLNVITLTLSPAKIKHISKNYVRAYGNIQYQLQAIDVSNSKLIITMHTEFGGDMPPAFVNSRLANELADDIEQLKLLLKAQ